MRSLSLLSFASLALLASAIPLPGVDDGKDGGPDVQIAAKLVATEHQKEISIKEVCYLELYLDIESHTIEYDKEVLIQDEHGADVFLRDGFKKDERNVEYYFKEFCYKKFHLSEHKEETKKGDLVTADDDRLMKIINDKDIDFGNLGSASGGKRISDKNFESDNLGSANNGKSISDKDIDFSNLGSANNGKSVADKDVDSDNLGSANNGKSIADKTIDFNNLSPRGFDDSFGDILGFGDYGKGFDYGKKGGDKFGGHKEKLDEDRFRKSRHNEKEVHYDSRKDEKEGDFGDRDDYWRA